MKKMILLLILIFLLPLSFAQEFAFLVSFSYDLNSDSFAFDSAKIIEGENIGFEQGNEEGYALKVFSETDSYEIKFKPESIIIIDPPAEELFDENGEQIYFPNVDEVIQVQEKTQHTMLLPYMDNAKMKILDSEGKTKLEIDLQEEINKQFPELQKEAEKEKTQTKDQTINLAIIIAVLIVAYFFINKTRKNKRK